MDTPGPKPILDTVALRVLAFAHPNGIAMLLATLDATSARFPAEVYNQDEASLPLRADDTGLSELARGLRFAHRQVVELPGAESQRYSSWLQHAAQLQLHLAQATLVIDPLTVQELPLRLHYQTAFGLGRGEAACLTLAHRYGAAVIFLSSDTLACDVAASQGISYLTLPDILMMWAEKFGPTSNEVDILVAGMKEARFGLSQEFVAALKVRSR